MFKYFFFFSILALILSYFVFFKQEADLFDEHMQRHQYILKEAQAQYGFNLVDPEQATPAIRNSVMRGYSIIMDTPFFAPNYSKDQLSCSSCHFSGGDTIGGRNNGISLVGVANIYPQFSERNQQVISLAERINNCFERSMSGKAMPLDSPEMHDIINYLNWISKEVELIKNPPWLGLKKLTAIYQPHSEQGEIIFNTYCAACHRDDGKGGGKLPEPIGKTIPPLWGENSFNDGAGMSDLSTLASFVYWNMPYQNSVLSEEEAIDVSAFILKQPRPHFVQ